MSFIGLSVQASEGAIKPIPMSVEHDPQKALLGKRLFFDNRLSGDGSFSCATCHDPLQGGSSDNCSKPWPADDPASSMHPRSCNPPTVFNAVFNFRQYWDGRAANLKEQAMAAVSNPLELNGVPASVLQRLNEDPDYPALFKAGYGDAAISLERVGDAIAEFEKTLITPNSKLDLYLRGEATLTLLEQEGFLLFKSLGCMACHNGVNLGGNSYQLSRTADADKSEDENRSAPQQVKVPTIRNIAITAPYMRDGSDQTLQEVLQTMAYHYIGILLEEKEWSGLTAFLHTLTGQIPASVISP